MSKYYHINFWKKICICASIFLNVHFCMIFSCSSSDATENAPVSFQTCLVFTCNAIMIITEITEVKILCTYMWFMCIFAFDFTMTKSRTLDKTSTETAVLKCFSCIWIKQLLLNFADWITQLSNLFKLVLASIDTLSILATFIWTIKMHV